MIAPPEMARSDEESKNCHISMRSQDILRENSETWSHLMRKSHSDEGYQTTTSGHIKLTVALSSAITQTTLRRTPTQLLLHQYLVQASSMPAMIAE